MLDLLRLLEKLNSPRRGWVQRGIPHSDTETINQHMYQMAMILMAYPNWVRRDINVIRAPSLQANQKNTDEKLAAVEMAIVHDAPEAIAGDVIPSDNMSRGNMFREGIFIHR
jgi:5'-deoxynucleotidase YfbR-like HD superfamily hydrolase